MEENAFHVNNAVQKVVDFKVERLAIQKRYSAELRSFVERHLQEKADGTFLWVALACRELGNARVRSITTKRVLQGLRNDLSLLYGQMLERVVSNEDTELGNYAITILRCTMVALRPLSLQELAVVASLPLEYQNDDESLKEYTDRCGCFLTVHEDLATGYPTAYFVHQSAQEYLASLDAGLSLHLNIAEEHAKMAICCVDYLCSDPFLSCSISISDTH